MKTDEVPLTKPGPSQPIEQWLQESSSRAVLKQIARSLLQQAGRKNLHLSFLGEADLRWDAVQGHRSAEVLDDLVQELSLFLLEKNEELCARGVWGSPRWIPYVRKAFIRRWIEKTRRPGIDPRRYLYKRLVDLMKASPEFHTESSGGFPLVFSLQDPSRRIPPLAEEDLRDIDLPMECTTGLSLDGIHRGETLLEIARHFWSAVCRLWGGRPVWIEVRDLATWLNFYVPLQGPQRMEGSEDEADLTGSLPDPAEYPASASFDPERLRSWARLQAEQFLGKLTRREREVLELYHGQGMGLAETALKLGYKGPSGVHYLLRGVRARLMEHFNELPWLSAHDMDPETLHLFWDELLGALARR